MTTIDPKYGKWMADLAAELEDSYNVYDMDSLDIDWDTYYWDDWEFKSAAADWYLNS